ncbi:MAG: YgcG family protein [Betaproteobacteria bacterium]
MARRLAAIGVAGLAALVVTLVLLPQAAAQVAIPALSARVTDLTGTLSADQKATLEQRLAAFEARKGSQVAVLMLPTTKPEEIEQFSIRLAEAWKVGRKGTDDGAILVVAKDDRRLRIEVGYGLEGVIPDAAAKRIISDTITPKFKTGDFYGGVSDGVDRITKLIDGEPLPPPAPGAALSRGRDFGEYLVPALFFIFIAGAALRAILGRFGGALATGVLAGVGGWFLFSIGIAALAAIVAFVFTLINTGRLGSGIGGFSGGSSGSGGFSSGDSSSWGGGGGSFGGGGSSGSW